MSDELRSQEQVEREREQDVNEYEEPSLVDLEDVSGGTGEGSCCTGGSATVVVE